MTRTALEFSHVRKAYSNGFIALEDVNLRVGAGELLAVVGPSGCGKSTVLRLAASLLTVTSGTVRKTKDDLAYVFQDPTLLAWRTVRANVELLCRIRGIPRQERRLRSSKALELVGLSDSADKLPHELSGGMRMRVSIARALATQPSLLLLDEPFGALDEFTRKRLNDELLNIWSSLGFAAVLVTHSIREAVNFGHRVAVMAPGPGRVIAVHESPLAPGSPAAAALRWVSPALSELADKISHELAFVS